MLGSGHVEFDGYIGAVQVESVGVVEIVGSGGHKADAKLGVAGIVRAADEADIKFVVLAGPVGVAEIVYNPADYTPVGRVGADALGGVNLAAAQCDQ